MVLNINQKKEFVVLTAIDLINEKGINNVSTKVIAKRIGISESLIFKIYPKKYDLFIAVLDFFSLYDKDMFQTALEKYENALEGLQFFVNKYLQYYENYPAITSVYQLLDSQTGFEQIDGRSKEINKNRLDYIKQLAERAQLAGQIDQEIDIDIAADILYSCVKGMCVKWRAEEFKFPLLERTNQVLELLFKAFCKR